MGFEGLTVVITNVQTLTTELNKAATAATTAATAIRNIPTFEGTQTSALSDLMTGAQKFLPSDAAPWSKFIREIIKNEIDRVSKGQETISDGLKNLQNSLKFFYEQFQRMLLDPATSKEARDFFQQLIQLILSGNFVGKNTNDLVKQAGEKLDKVAQDVALVPQRTGDAVTASIGDAVERFASLGGSTK